MGGSAPRILSIDDYFMTETDKEVVDEETGRKVTKKVSGDSILYGIYQQKPCERPSFYGVLVIFQVMEYEYEASMESVYHDSLIKAFRKTVSDGYFPFIIIDAVHGKPSQFEDITGFGRQKGFQVSHAFIDTV